MNARRTVDRFDVVGAGLGPFNLSLAALLAPLSELRARFFEAQPSFRWHCGIMVPGAQLQVSYLKDLVTLVICATGYRSQLPDYLAPLRGRIVDGDGALRVRRDYSLEWDGPPGLNIYVQNAAEDTHGIADPNLSLAAWRSARIVNAICGRDAYPIEGEVSAISWNGAGAYDPELSTSDVAEVNVR